MALSPLIACILLQATTPQTAQPPRTPQAAQAPQAPRTLFVVDPADDSPETAWMYHVLREQLQADQQLIVESYPETPESLIKAQANQQQGIQLLKDGKAALNDLDIEKALASLQKAQVLLAKAASWQLDLAPLKDALFALTATYLLLEDRAHATETINALTALDPKQQPSGELYNPGMLQEFNNIQSVWLAKPLSTVTITSTVPNSAVYWDGHFIGMAPVTLEKIIRGSHFLRVEAFRHEAVVQTTLVSTREVPIEVNLATPFDPTSYVKPLTDGVSPEPLSPTARSQFRALNLRTLLVLTHHGQDYHLFKYSSLTDPPRLGRATGQLKSEEKIKSLAAVLLRFDYVPAVPTASKKKKSSDIAVESGKKTKSDMLEPKVLLEQKPLPPRKQPKFLASMYSTSAALGIAAGVMTYLNLKDRAHFYEVDQVAGQRIANDSYTKALITDVLWGLAGAVLVATVAAQVWPEKVIVAKVEPPPPAPEIKKQVAPTVPSKPIQCAGNDPMMPRCLMDPVPIFL